MRTYSSTRWRFGLVLSALALLAISTPSRGAEKFDAAAMARTVAPFVDGETILVAHLDPARVSLAPIAAMIGRLVPDGAGEVSQAVKGTAGFFATLSREHINDVYLVVSLGGQNMVPRMSVLVSPAEPTRDLAALRAALQLPAQVELKVLSSSPPEDGAAKRPELAEALAAAGEDAVQVVLMPPASSRRVIDELLPQLPAEIGGGSTTVLTHGISWAALAVDLSLTPALRLTIKSQDTAAAEALRTRWLDGMKMAGEQKEIRQVLPDFDKLVALLTPKLSGNRLTFAVDEKDIAVAGLLVPMQHAIEKSREASQRSQAMNRLHQLGLAVQNYCSTFNNHFPAAASHTRDGKPLLSWRVAILPFIEQGPLYKQFHLDEPWDSPHNKTLIEKMPNDFRSPRSRTAKGYTNYLVPVGGGALYSSPTDEPGMKQITDGTSHTINLVEVDDEHAVVWTKPGEMPFDPQDPKKGIGSPYERGFFVVFCDGSVLFINKSIDPKTLKAYFTRAAGDPFYSDPPNTTPSQ